MTIRIAVAQMETIPGDVQHNRSRALALAGEGLKQQAHIILFPEGMITGYCDRFEELAEPADGPTAQAFRSLLKGSSTVVLFGLVEREDSRFYEAAVLVGAQGIFAHYRKTHLWWAATGVRNEVEHLTAGDKLVTFDLKGHKCGVMICYDGDFPEMTRSYANLGCSMLFWINMRHQRGHNEVKDLAGRNSMIMAVCCCCGKNEVGDACPGGSNITDHHARLLAEIWYREGVIVADVDPASVPQARKANVWYTGRRPDLYV
ncbi:MAG TPA: carbon-nitrogen hydrolase family protein [Planctomycetota bacterium]|nr:carbon-nitrogen hydrolase family protein [Planctomycetota bacterium]